MKRAEGWGFFFSFLFQKGFFFFLGGEGKRGVIPHPIQRGFFFCPLGREREWERCFFSSAGTFSTRGCFLIDMREGRGLVVSKCKG